MNNWTINHTVPIGPQIHRVLRERIIKNDLRSGSKISEPEISREYGISRQPAREAFIKLAEEGLVMIRPQRSTLVRKIDRSSVLDAQFVREAIEADIVKLLTHAPDPALITELNAQLDEQSLRGRPDPDVFIKLDEKFHRTLAEAAGKARAWDFIETLKSQMDRVRYLSFSKFPIDNLITQHRDIVHSIASGNVQDAEDAIRLHLREILSTLPEISDTFAEFFESEVKKV